MQRQKIFMFIYPIYYHNLRNISNGKGLSQEPGMAQGVPGRLRPRIFLTFGTTRVVGRRSDPSYSFLEAESTPGRMVSSVATEKIPSDTTGNRSRDRPTSSAVP
jgi:hypothetical protein